MPRPPIENLYEVYKESVKPTEDFMSASGMDCTEEVKIIFFMCKDNIHRALVTGKALEYPRGAYDWEHYYAKDGIWVGTEETIHTHPDYFGVLSEDGKKPKLILSFVWWRKEEDVGYVPDVFVSQKTDCITVDKKGRLKKIPMPEFTLKDVLFVYEEGPFPRFKLKPNDKLEPVKVETFYPKGFVKEN